MTGYSVVKIKFGRACTEYFSVGYGGSVCQVAGA